MADVLTIGPWWAFVVRGVFAVLFGILTFLMPAFALLTLIILFGMWAIADGAFNVAGALQRTEPRPRSPWVLLLAGIVGILAGLLAFFMPGVTALSLLYLIAGWMIVRGVFEIAAAVRLRKIIHGEWLFVLSGILSVVVGLFLFAFPGAGALAVVLWIGAYAIVFGVLLIALGLKLRKRPHERGRGGGLHEYAPVGSH